MKSVVRSVITLTALGLAAVLPSGVAGAEQADRELVSEAAKAPIGNVRTVHGLVQLIGEALGEVTLTQEQESVVEALGARVEPLQAAVDDAESTLLLALADQIQRGAVDRSAIEPQVQAYVSARLALSPELRDALDRLHGLLDDEQRADFADALQCRIHAVRRALVTGQKTDKIALALGLDAQQKARVDEILKTEKPGLQAERDVLHRTIEAFRGAELGLEALIPSSEVAGLARQRAERIVNATTSIADILNPGQRQRLAERIREATRVGIEEEPSVEAPAVSPQDEEPIGTASDAIWAAAGFRRGPFGGVRGGVAVGGRGVWGGPRFAYRRAAAYPYAVGWGYGWY